MYGIASTCEKKTKPSSFETVAWREESTFLETYPDEISYDHKSAWAAFTLLWSIFYNTDA